MLSVVVADEAAATELHADLDELDHEGARRMRLSPWRPEPGSTEVIWRAWWSVGSAQYGGGMVRPSRLRSSRMSWWSLSCGG
jgi:hypothetical protein